MIVLPRTPSPGPAAGKVPPRRCHRALAAVALALAGHAVLLQCAQGPDALRQPPGKRRADAEPATRWVMVVPAAAPGPDVAPKPKGAPAEADQAAGGPPLPSRKAPATPRPPPDTPPDPTPDPPPDTAPRAPVPGRAGDPPPAVLPGPGPVPRSMPTPTHALQPDPRHPSQDPADARQGGRETGASPVVPDGGPAGEAAPRGEPLPRYMTRMPPPFERAVIATRGGQPGGGRLRFAPAADGSYQLLLDLRGDDGAPWLEMASRGTLTGEGIGPDRFTDRRRGRSARATNFDRDAGHIRYAGAAPVHALEPGAQDRLSWLLQLAAIVAADPARWHAASAIVMQVAGVYADAGRWVFDCAPQHEGLLHCRREPRHLYDTRAEAWIAATPPHLPSRVRLTPVPAGPVLDLQLSADAPATAAP